VDPEAREAHSFPGLFVFMRPLLPLFLNVSGREVLLVGGGPVAAAKLAQLLGAGARVTVVAPAFSREMEVAAGEASVVIARREFVESDLDAVWLVIAAATPAVNVRVSEAAAARRIFVNAVDDPANATAYMGGIVRRETVTVAISTGGAAPALTSLLREALDALLPDDLSDWIRSARETRVAWRRDGVPMKDRKRLLLEALNGRYAGQPGPVRSPSAAVPMPDESENSCL
jgi:uroporphyrin-III C-methyltransferase / precorrin-2 dehydrogenase / sirohydrochlorin ferrochelatase